MIRALTGAAGLERKRARPLLVRPPLNRNLNSIESDEVFAILAASVPMRGIAFALPIGWRGKQGAGFWPLLTSGLAHLGYSALRSMRRTDPYTEKPRSARKFKKIWLSRRVPRLPTSFFFGCLPTMFPRGNAALP